jgi:lipid II:glycine glycyltransferase (peptidoglycan interpeptide bridge formation enzyme)
MDYRILTALNDEERAQWERWVVDHPGGHSFQRLSWGRFQEIYSGRENLYLIGTSGGRWRVVAQIFKRQWPRPFSSLANYEISCGPVFEDIRDFEETMRYLDRWAASAGAVQLKVGPRWPLTHYKNLLDAGRRLGFRGSSDPHTPIYAEETAIVDLRPAENDILKAFRYTTRYEIRKAQRAGVQVRFSNAPEAMTTFYDLHLQQRTRLQIAPEEERFFKMLQRHFLHDPDNGAIAMAEYEGRPLSAAIYFRFGKVCRYRHGASNEELRKRLDTSHLLHWMAMRHFKDAGCETYDFCGASPSLPRDYPTYGTNIFKTGFSKHFVRYTPDFMKTYRPLLSFLFGLRGWLSGAFRRVSGRLAVLRKPTRIVANP